MSTCARRRKRCYVTIALREPDSETRAAAVLGELADTDGDVRAMLVRVLGKLGGPQALAVIRASRAYEDERVVDAAVRALAAWPDAEVLDDLLNIARESKNTAHAVLALRGYVRLVDQPGRSYAFGVVRTPGRSAARWRSGSRTSGSCWERSATYRTRTHSGPSRRICVSRSCRTKPRRQCCKSHAPWRPSSRM